VAILYLLKKYLLLTKNLHYTRLIPFRVSRVRGAQLPISAALRQGPHIKVAAVASRWQRVGDRHMEKILMTYF